MHAFLLITEFKKTAGSKPVDELNADMSSLDDVINIDPIQFAKKQNAKVIPFTLQKIEDAKNLKKLIKFSFSEKTAIVINDIDQATIQASNAFLKNLEEPNDNLIYVLTTTNVENVLQTIVSRCEVIRLQVTGDRAQEKQLNYKDALNIKDRDQAIEFINQLIYQDKQKEDFKNMENYLITLKNLKLNGNVSLQMASLIVRMNGHGR